MKSIRNTIVTLFIALVSVASFGQTTLPDRSINSFSAQAQVKLMALSAEMKTQQKLVAKITINEMAVALADVVADIEALGINATPEEIQAIRERGVARIAVLESQSKVVLAKVQDKFKRAALAVIIQDDTQRALANEIKRIDAGAL